MKAIGHVDADSFYVSCERVRDRGLMGKPVCVLSNQGACVIACSYEAKALGIKVGVPVWEARKLFPDVIYIKRDFQWYGVLSAAMQDVLGAYSDQIEYYSIDESFLDFGDYRGSWKKLALDIQDQMMRQVGIPVSVGISMTRILAKIGSDFKKPLGTMIVRPSNLKQFLMRVPILEISGIGRRLALRLAPEGVETAWDYVNKPHWLIKKLLHKPGEEIWYELKGRSLLPVRTEKPEQKGVSRGGSLWGHHKDPKYIWGFLIRNLERFANALWKQDLEVGNLVLFLLTSDGKFVKHVEPLPVFTNNYSLLLLSLRSAFEKSFVAGVSYCASHLLGEPVRAGGKGQLEMFELEDEKSRALVKLRRELNEKFGVFAVRGGATAYVPKVFKDDASHFEISDVEGKFCF